MLTRDAARPYSQIEQLAAAYALTERLPWAWPGAAMDRREAAYETAHAAYIAAVEAAADADEAAYDAQPCDLFD